MEQGVVFVDSQNRSAYCNPAAEKIQNIRQDQILDQSILGLHPNKSHPKILKVIDDLRSGHAKGHHLMNVRMVDGKFYDNTFSAVWGPENDYLGVIVVSQEVTKRKEAEDDLKEALRKLQAANEDLKRLNRMKDDFLSNVSHELKTPMISVMGYIGMILKERVVPLTDEQRKFLEICYKNLLRLGKNIDDLLELAELGIRKKALIFEPIDLCKVIEFSCSTVEPFAKEHQIEMEVEVPQDIVTVSSIEDKLRELSIISDQVPSSTNQQGGKIGVSLFEDSDLTFTRITDTGIGITPIVEGRSSLAIFKRNALREYEGLRIGLSWFKRLSSSIGERFELRVR
jgi:PAS domain S-box-containing protein